MRIPSSTGWKKKIYDSQIHYLQDSTDITEQELSNITIKLSTDLSKLRRKYKMRLLHVDKVVKELSSENSDAVKTRIVQSVESVMKSCSLDMLEFAGEVIRHSMDTLSMQPPCDFSVVAIGS